MEKINTFVDNMFCGLPLTKEAVDIKLRVNESLEDKYSALLKQGKNENEAFGIIVNEFGSMNELKYELGVNELVENESKLAMYEYAKTRYRNIAIGVAFVMIGIFLAALFDEALPFLARLSGPAFILCAMIGVCILIYNSSSRGVESIELNTEYRKDRKKRIRFSSLIPLLPFIYIAYGSIMDSWHPSWLIVPVGCIVLPWIDKYLDL